MRFFGHLFYVSCLVLMHGVLFAMCPDGYTQYLGPVQSGVARNSSGVCLPLCDNGARRLVTSNGYKFNLFAEKTTFPSLHIKLGDGICYADLLPGRETGTVNVSVKDAIYHADMGVYLPCKTSYNLSFSCGDGATGIPPDSIEIGWGDLFTVPKYVDGCVRDGYTISGWKIDSETLESGEVYSYQYETDKTLVAQWVPNTYGAPYLCNPCLGFDAPNVYVGAIYSQSFTTETSLECKNPFEKKLEGFRVLDALGNDTGVLLTTGQTSNWRWADNMQLSAVWSGGIKPNEYTLSFSCGDGATGVPPAAQRVKSNQLFSVPQNSGTCARAGYHITGWMLDSELLVSKQVYPYTYTTNKTIVAQWEKNEYAAVYLCYTSQENQYFLSAYYGDTVTPNKKACTAPEGKVFSGYQILDVFGVDTGVFIPAGESFEWTYPYSLIFKAIWVMQE